MIKNITNILSNSFEWMKKDLIILLSLIVLISILINFINILTSVQLLIVVVIIGKCVMFTGEHSLLEGVGKDNFSWKFMQGLPLSKNELILSLLISDFIALIPLVVSLICFWPLFNTFMFHDFFVMNRSIAFLILFLILFNLFALKNRVEHSRKAYQRKNTNRQLIRFIRFSLVFVTLSVYFIGSIGYIERHFDIDLNKKIILIFKLIEYICMSWWLPLLMVGAILGMYFYLLMIWTNEKLSYKSTVWKPKIEYSLIVISSVLLFGFYTNVDWELPARYEGTLQKAVYEKNYGLIVNELDKKININSRNEYGMTPMFVAIEEGNIEMVRFLERNGANFDGISGRKKDKFIGSNALILAISSNKLNMVELIYPKVPNIKSYYDRLGFTPIHLAALKCQSRIIDFLIKNGSDVNALNDRGETPVVVSARANCLSAAVALKEAGANFDSIDKNGKSALDTLKKLKRPDAEFVYFLEKNTRKPASTK